MNLFNKLNSKKLTKRELTMNREYAVFNAGNVIKSGITLVNIKIERT